jgi:hypothetical protein
MSTVRLVEDGRDFRGVEGGERVLHEASRGAMGRHDEEKAIHPSADDAAVLYGGQGRGVDDNVVVLAAGFFEQLAQSRRLEHLVGAERSVPRGDDRQIEWGSRLGDPVEGEAGVQDRVHEAGAASIREAEERAKGRSSEVGVDQEHTSLRRLGEGSRQVDGGDGLAVARARARYCDDLKTCRPVELFHGMAERAILLGFEGGGRHKAHEVLINVAMGFRNVAMGFRSRRRDELCSGGFHRGGLPEAGLLGRGLLAEGPVPFSLLERLEELAHSGSRARADRARSERDKARGLMSRQAMLDCVAERTASPAAAVDAANTPHRVGVMRHVPDVRRGCSPSSR